MFTKTVTEKLYMYTNLLMEY